ncbi:hypothetical protein [Bacillus sp. EB600]|nr:hypothetical protein [Bacillus sp. EB600]
MKIIIVFNYGEFEFTNFDKVVRTLDNEFGLRLNRLWLLDR